MIPPSRGEDGRLAALSRIVVRDNGSATFANLNWGDLGPRLAEAKGKEDSLKAIVAHREKVLRDLKAHAGELKPLPEVKLSGAK